MRLETRCLGKPLWTEVAQLDDGLDVGVYGGDRTHVGAVTLCAPGGAPRTLQREGHRDAAVSEYWARALAEKQNVPVCVRCGIHFDDFSKDALPEIFTACDSLLKQLQTTL